MLWENRKGTESEPPAAAGCPNGHSACCCVGMLLEHSKPHIPGTIPQPPPEPPVPVEDPDPADTPDEQPRDD
jgi:hypothetical protein